RTGDDAALAGARRAFRPRAALPAAVRGAAVGLVVRFGEQPAAAVLVGYRQDAEPHRRTAARPQGSRGGRARAAVLGAGAGRRRTRRRRAVAPLPRSRRDPAPDAARPPFFRHPQNRRSLAMTRLPILAALLLPFA